MSRATSAQWGVACPPAPDGCGAAADAPCRANGGTGRVTETHVARMKAWGARGKPGVPAVGIDPVERAADVWWLSLSPSRRTQIHAWITQGSTAPIIPADEPLFPDIGAAS